MQTDVLMMDIRDIYSCKPIETKCSLGYSLVRIPCVNLCEVCAIASPVVNSEEKQAKQTTTTTKQIYALIHFLR